MEETWLNPDFVIRQMTILMAVFFGALLIVPVALGALVYLLLTLLAWLWRPRRAPETDYTDSD